MADIAKPENFIFANCREIPNSEHFKSLITWYRNELPQFTWAHFTKLMPDAWLAILMIDNRFAARLRINIGVPSEIKINTSMPFDPEKVIYIDKVYVDPHFQKKSFSEKLIQMTIARVRAFGASAQAEIWVETDRDNTAMIGVYKRLGWAETPTAKGGERLRWFALMRRLGAQ